jgi:pyruvate-formate lyase-activating enzyme
MEPYTIEVEATNCCNAKCIFCNNSVSQRKRGYLNCNDFEHFLNKAQYLKNNSWLNKTSNTQLFPRIVFGGQGEPTLHPMICELIALSKRYNFRTQLITNGSTLSTDFTKELLASGLDEIAISLHSVDKEIYYSVTHMDIAEVLPRIETFLDSVMVSGEKIKVEIWRILPPPNLRRDGEREATDFMQFLLKYPFVQSLGPSEPWSRDGRVYNSICPSVCDDLNNQIWCHKIFFTYNIAWDGSIVLCCNDYNNISCDLGNAFTNNLLDCYSIKQRILDKEYIPSVCSECRRWKDTEYENIYSEYLVDQL